MKGFAKRHLGKGMWFLVGVMALALIEGHAAGQCDEQKILASDGVFSDGFGRSVSISGDVAIVGSASENGLGANTCPWRKLHPAC